MPSLTYYIVDVFAEEKYAGNQLAVFLQTHALSTEQMQQITREINFAESTFIDSNNVRAGGFDVRIFTPAQEMPFAGHPTLGTSWVIQEKILKRPEPTVTLNLKVGKIPVKIERKDGKTDVLWMKQINPSFGDKLDPGPMLEAIRLTNEDYDDRFPVQFVSTGIPFVIIPLKSLDAVKRARLNYEKYDAAVKTYGSKALFFFAPETYHPDRHLNARMFAPEFQVVEDAATGSANGCLAGYLVKYRYFGGKEIDIQVEQGYEMKRPSLLMLKASEISDNEIDVRVGGRVQYIAEGSWSV